MKDMITTALSWLPELKRPRLTLAMGLQPSLSLARRTLRDQWGEHVNRDDKKCVAAGGAYPDGGGTEDYWCKQWAKDYFRECPGSERRTQDPNAVRWIRI